MELIPIGTTVKALFSARIGEVKGHYPWDGGIRYEVLFSGDDRITLVSTRDVADPLDRIHSAIAAWKAMLHKTEYCHMSVGYECNKPESYETLKAVFHHFGYSDAKAKHEGKINFYWTWCVVQGCKICAPPNQNVKPRRR